MTAFLTPEQNIALRLIFAAMGDTPFNRSLAQYTAIAARAPKLAALHREINKYLEQMAASGYVPFQICTFKGSGPSRDCDRYWRYKKFPASLSIETIRLAWVKSGTRELQRQHKQRRSNGEG